MSVDKGTRRPPSPHQTVGGAGGALQPAAGLPQQDAVAQEAGEALLLVLHLRNPAGRSGPHFVIRDAKVTRPKGPVTMADREGVPSGHREPDFNCIF